MPDAKQSPPVIELTEETAAAHSITPELQRPVKQRRIFSRIQNQNARTSETTAAAAAADNEVSRRVLNARTCRSDGQNCNTAPKTRIHLHLLNQG